MWQKHLVLVRHWLDEITTATNVLPLYERNFCHTLYFILDSIFFILILIQVFQSFLLYFSNPRLTEKKYWIKFHFLCTEKVLEINYILDSTWFHSNERLFRFKGDLRRWVNWKTIMCNIREVKQYFWYWNHLKYHQYIMNILNVEVQVN